MDIYNWAKTGLVYYLVGGINLIIGLIIFINLVLRLSKDDNYYAYHDKLNTVLFSLY